MTKEEVQSRVSHNGKPLPLEDFDWDVENRVFSSNVNGLMLDFKDVNGVTFKTSSYCTFITDSHCTFDTGNDCTFNTDWKCTFKTGALCTFKTEHNCKFNTGCNCTFDTDSNCTFKTGSGCTFDTSSYCTFNIDEQCVIIRRDIYEVIPDKKEIQLCPYNIKGYIEKIDDTWYLNSDTSLGEHILTDNILSKVISKKKLDNGIVYRVYNYTAKGISSMPSYLIEIDGIYAHGSSIKDAKDSIIYKMVDRDTSAYTDMTLDTVYTIPEAIRMYRTITGACSEGVKMFVDGMDNVPDTISVKDILDITSGQYGHDVLKEYIDKTI